MVLRILKGYLGLLVALGRIVALGAACIGAGLAIVYPLWRLATSRPDVYTLVCGVLFVAVAGSIAAIRMRTALRLNPARFRRNLLKFAVLAAGISIAVALLLSLHRFLALAALVVTAAAWGLIEFVLEPSVSNGK